MNTTARLFWVSTLCVFVSGCATYRSASLPEPVPEMGSGGGGSSVREGDTVRILLRSGETVSGEVMWMTNEEVSLGNRGNYGGEDLAVAISTIESIEVRNESDGEIEGLWFISMGVALLISAFIGLQSMGAT